MAIASVHLADVGIRTALPLLRKPPKPSSHPGLRSATVAFGAPLRASFFPSPDFRRLALVAFWDDDDALDRFLSEDRLAEALAGGWHVRLQPLRAFGTWPGLSEDVPTARSVDHEGPAAVLTLGRLRLTQVVRFLRTSAKAEARVLQAPGLIFSTGLGRPPFVGTCSLWETTKALSTYAYGQKEPAHANAIAEGEAKAFHHQQAFIRFRPYGSMGSLGGKNPLSESWMTSSDGPRAATRPPQ